jgi:flavin reductase (DIM6/NTAB) family NADH-FMN oxidoreductase RutF
MELDLEHQYADRAYAILTNLVTPRPIALVTTLSPDGKINAAPFSFFNVLGANPPLVAFSPADREPGVPKDTALNVRATHEFVINLVDAGIQEGMNQCAAPLPYGENELLKAKLTATPSKSVKPPRIAEAPASLECVEWGTLQIGGNRVVLGIVKHIHVKDEYFDAEKKRVLGEKIFLIGRMASPNWYCTTKDRFELERPS